MTKRRHSITYLALNKKGLINPDLSAIQEDLDDVVQDDVGKMIPQAEDLPCLHLLNWVDEGSNVHVLKYIATVFQNYKRNNAEIQAQSKSGRI